MTKTASLTLYGRAWCHLCEDMRAALEPLLAEFGAQLAVIDVDRDPLLEARYNELVPVLVCDGVELCHHHLDEARVRAALAAHASRVAAAS
ncbi:glutaredoxin family protein [Paraburkholderia sp. JPY419]|uniref:glutaredoxin family protein n=1 Tax=Paraburkholderia sp. JPY419 TaxID=667660 RepID=UPI003D2338B2